MELERDRVEILAGIRAGSTIGGPVALLVRNAEYEKWKEIMRIEVGDAGASMTRLRPGHADLAGALKYGTRDVRNVLERASARTTVGRVCAGALAKRFLAELEIFVGSHVVAVGSISAKGGVPEWEAIRGADNDPMRCLDAAASLLMRKEIDRVGEQGDSLGGTFEIVAYGLPAGLGSYVHWDRRLDARLAAAVMSIQAVKGVEVGDGFGLSRLAGSQAVDVIRHEEGRGFFHLTNHSGGVEGGMTNGEDVVMRAAMKPIPTLGDPLGSVDLVTKQEVKAAVERADICAVPAAAVIAESAVALVISDALLEKTGGDSMAEVRSRYRAILDEQALF